MRIATVVGARPQFIKAAVVSHGLRSRPEIQEVLVHTGQHYDENMSGAFFRELDVPRPDYNLGVGSGSHATQTARMLEGLERVLIETGPDWTLLYGDTNSTLAGALAASKLRIPVAHVEAGPRGYNRAVPEEVNRLVADHLSDLLFAPTSGCVENLRREGIAEHRIRLVGDVMYDAAIRYGERAGRESAILETLGLRPKEYVLATVHRAENTDDADRLRAAFEGLARLAERIPVVLPLHPRSRNALTREGLLEEVSRRIRIVDPVGYLDMIMLEKGARLVVSDSGGVPKEAFFYRVPSVMLRAEALWDEIVELGWSRTAAPTSADAVLSAAVAALESAPGRDAAPYGDGRSVERIVDALLQGPPATPAKKALDVSGRTCRRTRQGEGA